MTCASPLDAAVLADYWLGLLDRSAEEAVDEHLLGCDQCGHQLRGVMALVEGVRGLARAGSLRMVVSDLFLERAAQDGLQVRAYTPPEGGSVQCTVSAEDDILVGRLAADMSGARRVDLSLSDQHGVELARMTDIPVRAGAGSSVAYQESITFMKAAPSLTLIARLVAIDDAGGERLLGEYTFNHTRTLPGPGAW
ncbi:MAG TPA: hypothetical protein VM487_01800 [Phycisphaerae bacterium]|nr:hypothetical protein [Phycisphaerae bacterium]